MHQKGSPHHSQNFNFYNVNWNCKSRTENYFEKEKESEKRPIPCRCSGIFMFSSFKQHSVSSLQRLAKEQVNSQYLVCIKGNRTFLVTITLRRPGPALISELLLPTLTTPAWSREEELSDRFQTMHITRTSVTEFMESWAAILFLIFWNVARLHPAWHFLSIRCTRVTLCDTEGESSLLLYQRLSLQVCPSSRLFFFFFAMGCVHLPERKKKWEITPGGGQVALSSLLSSKDSGYTHTPGIFLKLPYPGLEPAKLAMWDPAP